VGEIWQVTLLEQPGHLMALSASGWWWVVEKEGFTLVFWQLLELEPSQSQAM